MADFEQPRRLYAPQRLSVRKAILPAADVRDIRCAGRCRELREARIVDCGAASARDDEQRIHRTTGGSLRSPAEGEVWRIARGFGRRRMEDRLWPRALEGGKG